MFKFSIIESQQQLFEKQFFDSVAKKLEIYQDISLAKRSQSNFIFMITEGGEKSIVRGAMLLKKALSHIHESVRDLVSTLPLHEGQVWECSRIFLETICEYSTSGSCESMQFSQNFYKCLYEGFVEFGKKKGINFIIMKLPSRIYLLTKEVGLWPYVVELKPSKLSDSLFHGILPLTGSQYKAYQKIAEQF